MAPPSTSTCRIPRRPSWVEQLAEVALVLDTRPNPCTRRGTTHNDAQGVAAVHVAHRQRWIIGAHGACTDDYGVALGASRCESVRASGPVIHRLVPSGAAIRPSSVAASLRTTKGRPVVRCVR